MWDVFMGCIGIAAAAYFYLYRRGVLPRNPSDPAATEEFRAQWATPLKWLPPVVFVLSLIRIGFAFG